MKNPYEDMINLSHYVSPTRPRMPSANRAAQFAPFGAISAITDIAVYQKKSLIRNIV